MSCMDKPNAHNIACGITQIIYESTPKEEVKEVFDHFVETLKQTQASVEMSLICIEALRKTSILEQKRFGKGDRRRNKKHFNNQFKK